MPSTPDFFNDTPATDEAADEWFGTSTIFGSNNLSPDGMEYPSADFNPALRDDSQLRLAASVFDNTRDGIMITDRSGRIIEINRAFTRITGYSPSEVIGESPSILKSSTHKQEFYAALWSSLVALGHWRGEICNRRKTGELFVQLMSVSAIRNSRRELTHYVAIYTDITALKETQERLKYLAFHDALTHLPNRVLLADRINQALALAKRHESMLAVCFADLDEFKPINDLHGHQIGDQLLIEVANRLTEAVREGDSVARLGGDEFAIVLSELQDPEEAEQILSRVRESLASPYTLDGIEARVTVSIGYTLVPSDQADPDNLLRHADQAMYQAKQEGRNRIHCFDIENDRQIQRHQQNLTRLRQALLDDELCIFYQPKVNLREGTVVGLEALIRWHHPERGLLLPADFLLKLGEHPLVAEIGDWVIATVLKQMAAWTTIGLHLPVSINLAGSHLLHPNFVAKLKIHLATHPQINPANVELEILETAAIEDVHHVSKLIGQCRELGVEFALDDFGTGYSSLLYLKRLPAKTLKIDQSFVRDLLETAESAEALAGIVTLAKAFRRQVVIEGMESIEQGIVLLRLNCDITQGFGIAHPMPPHSLPGWVANFKPDPCWQDSLDRPWRNSDFPLLAAVVEQRQWLQHVIATVAQGGQLLRDQQISHLRAGRFGGWLHGLGHGRYGHLPEFAAIAGLLTKAHRVSAEIGIWLKRDDKIHAQSLLTAQIRDSTALIDALDALREAIAHIPHQVIEATPPR